MPYKEVHVTQRVWEIDPTQPQEWSCVTCGFANKPRPVTNSLNTLPANHPLFDPAWRISHCEQCGAERPA